MAATQINFSDAGNLALVRELIAREASDRMVWSKMVGIDTPGTERMFKIEARTTSVDSPIVVKSDFISEGRDSMLLTLLRELTGTGVMGSDTLINKGEAQVRNFMDIFVNPVRHAVKPPDVFQRSRVKEANLLEEAKPQLSSWIARRADYMISSAWYKTYSDNITAATSVGGYGSRATEKPHPMIFVSDGTTATRVSHSTTLATYNTNLSTAFTGVTGTDTMSLKLLQSFKRQLMENTIPTISNDWWHVLYMSLGQWQQLQQDADFINAVHNSGPRDLAENPIFSGKAHFVAGFIIVPVPNNIIWGATTADPPVFGATLSNYMSKNYDDANAVRGAIAMGPASMCWGLSRGLFTTSEVLDHGFQEERGIGIFAGAALTRWEDSISSPTTMLQQSSALLFTNSP